MDVSLAWWVAVVAVILGMLAIDLFFFHRQAHEVTAREAGIWTVVWVVLGLGFGAVVAWQFGLDLGAQYLAGYVIEKSLAVDNIFVFAVIFAAFSIPLKYQHRVLFWGVIGALVLRGVFIAAGAALLEQFHWTIYLFGGLLIVTAWRMWSHRHHHPDPANNPAISCTSDTDCGGGFCQTATRHRPSVDCATVNDDADVDGVEAPGQRLGVPVRRHQVNRGRHV